jgi:hypothetical protein
MGKSISITHRRKRTDSPPPAVFDSVTAPTIYKKEKITL